MLVCGFLYFVTFGHISRIRLFKGYYSLLISVESTFLSPGLPKNRYMGFKTPKKGKSPSLPLAKKT